MSEHENPLNPENIEVLKVQMKEIGALAMQIFDLAKDLKLYTEIASGDLFQLMDDIGEKCIEDDRQEVSKLINMLLAIRELRSKMIVPNLRLQIIIEPDGNIKIGTQP